MQKLRRLGRHCHTMQMAGTLFGGQKEREGVLKHHAAHTSVRHRRRTPRKLHSQPKSEPNFCVLPVHNSSCLIPDALPTHQHSVCVCTVYIHAVYMLCRVFNAHCAQPHIYWRRCVDYFSIAHCAALHARTNSLRSPFPSACLLVELSACASWWRTLSV